VRLLVELGLENEANAYKLADIAKAALSKEFNHPKYKLGKVVVYSVQRTDGVYDAAIDLAGKVLQKIDDSITEHGYQRHHER